MGIKVDKLHNLLYSVYICSAHVGNSLQKPLQRLQ